MPWQPGTHPNTLAALKAAQGAGLQKRAKEGLALRKRINELIDQEFGDGAREAIMFIGSVMRGTATGPARKPLPGEDSASYAALVPQVSPTVRERLEAAFWIAERRNGKAPASMEVSGTVDISPGLPVDLNAYTDAELEIAEALLSKGQRVAPAEEEVDAEFTAIVPVVRP